MRKQIILSGCILHLCVLSAQDIQVIPEKTVNLEEITVMGNRKDRVTRTATGEIFYLSEQAKNAGDPFRALQEVPRIHSDIANRKITMDDGVQPLILINGNRYNSGIATIDPKEIQSVEVIDVVKARYLKDGYQKIIDIKLKKKTKPFVFFETATRHNLPFRRGLGVVYFEVGNPRYALYGRSAVDYTHNEESEKETRQENDGYKKFSTGKERLDGNNYLGELQFRWMCTDHDYVVAHIYGNKDLKKSRTWGEGLLNTDSSQDFNYLSTNRDQSYILTGSLFHKHTFSESHLLETTLAFNKNHNENSGTRAETYPDWLYSNAYVYKNDRNSGSLYINYSYDFNAGGSLNIGSQTNVINDHIRRVSENLPTFYHRQWDEYLYADLSGSGKRFSYMLSAGLESIWLKAGEASNHYFKPRASMSGTYNFSEHYSMKLGYTLSNTAPSVSELNPYNMSTDSLVITRGNPALLPSQTHDWDLSGTFNTGGLYITPGISYRICTDIVESYGFNEEQIYISSYHNNGIYKKLRMGGIVSYRIKNLGRIGLSAYHGTEYFERQEAKNYFDCSLSFSTNYKKWYFGADISYTNYEYTALSRTRYHAPTFSMLQVSYYFTKNFYISAAIENCLSIYRTRTDLQSGNYRNSTLSRQTSASFSPWILIRYTLRKNGKQGMKEKKNLYSREKGIVL